MREQEHRQTARRLHQRDDQADRDRDSVISQPDAALYIQPPILETSVAVQITAKAGWRNGAQGEDDDEAAAPPIRAARASLIPHAGGLCASQRPASAAANSSASAALTAAGSSLVMV